jgi:hypothetical protein
VSREILPDARISWGGGFHVRLIAADGDLRSVIIVAGNMASMCVACNQHMDCIIRVYHPCSELFVVISTGSCGKKLSLECPLQFVTHLIESAPLPSPPPTLHLVFSFRLAMPMMVINLGGEMMYILQQRLVAQNIPRDKVRYTPSAHLLLLKPQESRCFLLPPMVDLGKRDHELLT